MSGQEENSEASQSEPSFEELLAQSESETITRVTPGQKLKASVVQKDAEYVHVDIGMRSEAMIRQSDDPRLVELVVGDKIEVFVVSGGYEVEVSLDPILGKGDVSVLADAYESESLVQGKVESTNPGGYSINVAGVRCFCPHSQIDLKRVENPQEFLGQTFDFKIIEFAEGGQNVVVSRRRIQQEALDKVIAVTRAKITPGATLPGTVREIREFGAFVDLGGIQGLLHISELGHQRIERVEDVLTLDMQLDVQVLEISKDDRGRDRISLSLKALLPDPWDSLKLERGAKLAGCVAKTRDFGIFVEIAPHVQGLIPLRFLKQEGKHMNAAQFDQGQEIEVEIVDWDDQSRQVTLGLPGWDIELHSSLKAGDVIQARVVKIIGAGLIVEGLDDPARGLLPKRLLDLTSHKQIEKEFPVGSEHRLTVDGIDDRGRYSFAPLSEKDHVDPAVVDQYTSPSAAIGHNPFASFFKKKDD